MDDVVAEATASARVFAELLAAFAAVALLLAATGVYALLSFFVAQRTRELGLRVALGAVRPQVVRLVLRQSAALASVGVALGLAGDPRARVAVVAPGVVDLPLQPLALLAELLPGQGTLMKLPPMLWNFWIDLVVQTADHVAPAAAQPLDPTLTGCHVSHLAVEHRHGDRRLIDKGAQIPRL